MSLGFLFEWWREPWLSREEIQRSWSTSGLSCLRGGGGIVWLSSTAQKKEPVNWLLVSILKCFSGPCCCLYVWVSLRFSGTWVPSWCLSMREKLQRWQFHFHQSGKPGLLVNQREGFFSDFPRNKVNILPQYLMHFILEALYEVSFAQITLCVW